MKKLILILFLFIYQFSFGQIIDLSTYCDGKIHVKSDLSKRLKNINYSDYIKKYIDSISPELKNYVENSRKSLISIAPIRCNPNEVVFISKDEINNKIICKIKIGTQIYRIPDTSICMMIPLLGRMNSETGKKYIGKIQRGSEYKYEAINKIEMKIDSETIIIDSTYYELLINPNSCYTESFIKPISLYYSPSKKVFYLYIYGLPDYNFTNYERYLDTYVHKIIFNKNGVIGKMTISGSILSQFAWYECPNFIPF